MADTKKAEAEARFVIRGDNVVDLKEKRYAPFGGAADNVAVQCNLDPKYADTFVWVQGLPPAS